MAIIVLGKAIQKIGDHDLILAGWHAVWWFGIFLDVVVLVTFGLVVTAPPRLAQQERKPPGSLGRMLLNPSGWLLAFATFGLSLIGYSTWALSWPKRSTVTLSRPASEPA